MFQEAKQGKKIKNNHARKVFISAAVQEQSHAQ